MILAADVRARRRIPAIVFVWLTELAFGLVVATPVHAWASRSWGAHPDGDAVLWRPGAFELMSWFGSDESALPTVFRSTAILIVAGAVLGQLLLGGLLASLALAREDGRRLRLTDALGVAPRLFLPLSAVAVAAALVELTGLGIAGFGASLVGRALVARLGESPAFTVRVALFAVLALPVLVLGVTADFARAAVLYESVDDADAHSMAIAFRALKSAIRVARRRIAVGFAGWAGRALASLALVALGYVAADALGGLGGAALVALFAVHQAVVFGRAALRASWLAQALRLTQEARASER